MTLAPATSTQRQLPRKRKLAGKRRKLACAACARGEANDIDVNSSGLVPAKAIQTDEATCESRDSIQMNEVQSDPRLDTVARIERARIEIRKLVDVIVLGADIELLDLMRDEIGSYSRHKAAQEARKWAEAAGIQIETGLMMLDRALRSAGK